MARGVTATYGVPVGFKGKTCMSPTACRWRVKVMAKVTIDRLVDSKTAVNLKELGHDI